MYCLNQNSDHYYITFSNFDKNHLLPFIFQKIARLKDKIA